MVTFVELVAPHFDEGTEDQATGLTLGPSGVPCTLQNEQESYFSTAVPPGDSLGRVFFAGGLNECFMEVHE
jgi:hypothetical protein